MDIKVLVVPFGESEKKAAKALEELLNHWLKDEQYREAIIQAAVRKMVYGEFD